MSPALGKKKHFPVLTNRKCCHIGRGDLYFLLDFLKKHIVVNNHSNFERKFLPNFNFAGITFIYALDLFRETAGTTFYEFGILNSDYESKKVPRGEIIKLTIFLYELSIPLS